MSDSLPFPDDPMTCNLAPVDAAEASRVVREFVRGLHELAAVLKNVQVEGNLAATADARLREAALDAVSVMREAAGAVKWCDPCDAMRLDGAALKLVQALGEE